MSGGHADEVSPDQVIKSLQEQLEEKNEQVFDLSLTVTAIEAETKHRIDSIQQETSQQVRLLQEQLRRAQQEANLARSQAQSLQARLQQQQQRQHGAADAEPSPVQSPSQPAPQVEPGQVPKSAADTPSITVWRDSTYPFPQRLVQMLLPRSPGLVPWLLSLPMDTGAEQVLSLLVGRFLRRPHEELETLEAIHCTLLSMPPSTLPVDTSRILLDPASGDGKAFMDLFREAQQKLLQPEYMRSAAHSALLSDLTVELLEMAETSDPGGWLALQVLAVLLPEADDATREALPWPRLVRAFCRVATQWMRDLYGTRGNRGLRLRYSTYHPLEREEVPDDDEDQNDKSGGGDEDSPSVSLDPMKYLILALPILTLIICQQDLSEQLTYTGREQEHSGRTLLAAVLDVLEVVIVRHWRQLSGEGEKAPDFTTPRHQVMAFCSECVDLFRTLAQSPEGILLLRTQMATTLSTKKRWDKAGSAIAISETLFHNIVILQHQNDHLYDYSQFDWNPIRDDLVRFFHQLLRSVEINRLRFEEKVLQQPQYQKDYVSFGPILSECSDLYISGAALLVNVTESSTVKVSKEIISMLKAQLNELSEDEEDLDA